MNNFPIKRRYSFFLLALVVFCSFGTNRMMAQSTAALDNYLEEIIDLHEVPGMAVAILKGEEVIYEKYLGVADLNHYVPVCEHTLFRVYSATKVLAAVGIFQLQEQGKLSIEDPISKHLTKLPEGWGDRRIKDLLAHASGLPDFARLPSVPKEEELMKVLAEKPLDFSPGDRFAYNQTNYWLLAQVIEATSGLSFDNFIFQQQLSGAKGTFAFSSNAHDVIRNRSGKYLHTENGWVLSGDEAGSYGHAANGLAISLPAFLYFAHQLQQGELLADAQLKQLLSPYPFKNEKDKFQHGWAPYPLNGQRSYGFTGGGVSGFRHFPDQDLTIIYMSNGYKCFPVHNTVINHLAGMVDEQLLDTEEEAKTSIVNLFLSEEAPQDLSRTYASWREQHQDIELESTLNSLGYALMRSGRMERALEVLKQNAKENPDSWNVHDSLGEAYAETGNLPAAIKSYKKSISLNPDNQNGKNWLEHLNQQIK